MAEKNQILESMAVSIFCQEMSMMLQAGIGPEEALGLLSDDTKEGMLHQVLKGMEKEMILGESFASAVKKSGAFPVYAADMIDAGEKAGRLEHVLRSLRGYYERQDHLESQIRSAVIYPLSLLLMMSVVLLLMVTLVLPVFVNVYENMAGTLAASSYGYIHAARIISIVSLIVIGLISLVILALFIISGTTKGKEWVQSILRRFPLTKAAMLQLSVSQFTDVLSTFLSSGMDTDTAMEEAVSLVSHPELKKTVDQVFADMQGGKSLSQALYDHSVYPSLYGRMLLTAARSGQTEEMLAKLADVTGMDAEEKIEGLISAIEPVMTGFLTVSVGITLLSIMLPLAGMLSAIG